MMAINTGRTTAVIYHWTATGMNSDGGIGEYVRLTDHQAVGADFARMVELLRAVQENRDGQIVHAATLRRVDEFLRQIVEAG